MHKLDLTSVDETQFDVKRQDGMVLIVPRKDKHVWMEDEKALRSVVVREKDKVVISRGFPKFLNYHEDPELHDDALRKSYNIHVMPKMDGSLIIVSYYPTILLGSDEVLGEDENLVSHLVRTRGSLDLGEFHDPVMNLLTTRYPKLLDPNFYHIFCGHSFMFEYTSPHNQIVVEYDECELTFLGIVQHSSGHTVTGEEVHRLFSERVIEEWPVLNTLNGKIEIYDNEHDFYEAMKHVRSRENDEGVVVEAAGRLFKVKSEWYVMLHSLRFQFSEKKLCKLLVLEQIYNFEELREYLYTLGYDFEVTEFLKEVSREYFTRLLDFLTMSLRVDHHLNSLVDQELTRKDIVSNLQSQEWLPPWGFNYCMRRLDEKDVTYYPYAVAAQESLTTVTNWFSNKDSELSELLKTPMEDEE